ncbi:MAG: DUF6538 domain-containing protein [Albidovulum sp.]
MHHAAYLTTSRHGIFYFRWPIPVGFHPQRRRTDIKISLGTRSPSTARQLSRMMISAGQSLILKASQRNMRYQDIRQHVQDHYRNLLRGFKEDVSAHGPIEGQRLDSLRTSKDWAETDPEDFLGIGYPDGLDGLLRKFCELAGVIPPKISGVQK